MSLLDSIKSVFEFKSPVEWFYENVEIAEVEWWLSGNNSYPNLFWARIRIFSDGKADILFQNGNKLFGFDNKESASNFISEDEFTNFENLDKNDRNSLVIPNDAEVQTPVWKNNEAKNFIYIGKF